MNDIQESFRSFPSWVFLGPVRGRVESGPASELAHTRPTTRTRELSITPSRRADTSDRRLTQRDVDEWLARLLLDLAEARELAGRARSERLQLAVEALDGATLNVLRELGTIRDLPDLSDIVARAIAEGRGDSSSLRLLGRDLRGF